jgi:alkanesulfonate monooxygenase SsuD/methylene tetrahydromethanopterin reductase-like flavin-dependent oxidoreductase (luciferase family)
MIERTETVDSLPSRPLELEEVKDLADNEGIETVLSDDGTIEVTDTQSFAYNVVLVLTGSVTGAVYIEEDEQWYRVYHESRPDATLDAAYDTIREVRGEETLFSRSPLTVPEAVFRADRPTGEDTSGYVAGDDFDSPWDKLRSERFLVGTPAEVLADVERYVEAMDLDILVVRTQFPGADLEDVRRSIELFGDEVIPNV